MQLQVRAFWRSVDLSVVSLAVAKSPDSTDALEWAVCEQMDALRLLSPRIDEV
jgi:phage terminase large subunit-like protein